MAKKDLNLNPPTKKTELTKENMLAFMKDKSLEERTWFVELMNSHPIRRKNALKDNEVVDSYDFKVIREEFAKKYFPEISSKYKAQKKNDNTKKKPTFEDELKELLK